MKQPGTLVEHEGDSYLLVEGGFDELTREVTLMVHPENALFTHDEHMRPLSWRDQGEWYPVARSGREQLVIQDPRHESHRDLVETIVERYLEARPATPDVAWIIATPRGYASSLEPMLPMGLAAAVYDGLGRAEDAGRDEDNIVAVQNVAVFLTHLAREGYAGAMWNGLLPVYFCLDENGDLQFLRVSRGRGGQVEMELLQPDGDWDPYDGAEEIEFLDHRSACDARLVQSLGPRPLVEWPEDGRLWSVGPSAGVPGVVTNEEDNTNYGMLFTLEESADSWHSELDASWVTFAVDDIGDYLRHDELSGCGALLNPGDHRARSGVLWNDGKRTVLDSFSGFWALEGGRFEQID